MTNRTQINAEQEFTQFVNGERKRTKGIPAELGDGNGVITHPTRSGFVKARLYGDNRQIISVRDALSVPAVENLPILVEKVITEGKYFYKYVGRNDGMSYASDPMVGAVGSHAPQHLRGDYGTGGFDPVDVYNRALIEVRAQAQATPNMTVYVTPGPYIVDGLGHEWAGGNSAAMVAPADTRCDLIYLGNDHALHILAGSDMAYPPTKPTIPVNVFPIAWIELTSATTSITETNIGNAKIIGSQTLPATMPPSAHNILSASHGDTLADTVVRGDLIIGNATPKWARLAHPGSANRFLTTTATDVVWSAGQLYIGVNHLFNFAWDDDASAYVGSIWDGIHAAAGFYFSAGAILTVLTSGTAALGAGTLTVSSTNDVTGATHTHAITASADVSAGTSALLKSNAGALNLQSLVLVGGLFQSYRNGENPNQVYSYDDNPNLYPYFSFLRARNTIASPANIQTDDIVGAVNFWGRVNGSYAIGGTLSCYAAYVSGATFVPGIELIVGSTIATYFYASGVYFPIPVNFFAGVDIAFATTTGTKIGTAANQLLAFYGATPIVQQTGVAVSAAGIHAALVNLGLITA